MQIGKFIMPASNDASKLHSQAATDHDAAAKQHRKAAECHEKKRPLTKNKTLKLQWIAVVLHRKSRKAHAIVQQCSLTNFEIDSSVYSGASAIGKTGIQKNKDPQKDKSCTPQIDNATLIDVRRIFT
jgi:hypothetical protein